VAIFDARIFGRFNDHWRHCDRSCDEKEEQKSKLARFECVPVLLTAQRKDGAGKV